MDTRNAIVLKAEKDFNVPLDRLYSAWVTPDELKQWWRPMGNHLKEVNIDLKEGGTFKYVFETDHHDQAFEISGKYEDVKEGEKLAYSWNWSIPTQAIQDGQFKLTIVFKSEGNGSRLEVTQENFNSEEALLPHREGWDKSLNDLHQYLSSKAS